MNPFTDVITLPSVPLSTLPPTDSVAVHSVPTGCQTLCWILRKWEGKRHTFCAGELETTPCGRQAEVFRPLRYLLWPGTELSLEQGPWEATGTIKGLQRGRACLGSGRMGVSEPRSKAFLAQTPRRRHTLRPQQAIVCDGHGRKDEGKPGTISWGGPCDVLAGRDV